MASVRFMPPTLRVSGSIAGLTIAARIQSAVLRVNNRRRRSPSEREILRIVSLKAALRAWDALTVAQRGTWNTAAQNALDATPGAGQRFVSGSQLHTASFTTRSRAGASIVTDADPDAYLQVDPTALWFTPDLSAQTITIRALENEFPAGGIDPRGVVQIRKPRIRSRKHSDRASAFLATWDWSLGAPGFGQAAIVASSPFPLLSANAFGIVNRSTTELGVVSFRRWAEVLTPPPGHGTAGYVRPFFFGLESPSITIDPGPVLTIVDTIGEFPSSFTRDFSSPPGQTVDDVMDWISSVAGWTVLDRDVSLDPEPVASIEPFGRSVVTLNWQPRAIFVALP